MKRAIKKFSVLIAVVLIMSVLAASMPFSFAATIPKSHTCAKELEELGVNLESFNQTLRQGLDNCETNIDISSYNIPRDADAYNLSLMITYVRYHLPEYINIKNIQGAATSTQIKRLVITYDEAMNTPEEFEPKREQLDTAISAMLEGIENSSLSDVEKALIVHDRLIDFVSYDKNVAAGTDVPDESYTMYGVFFNRVAVCDGYAKAYAYMLGRLGITALVVSSPLLQHAWNLVYIDGKPYYVDCTWDDPTGAYDGEILHNNFLRSENGIIETNHIKNGQIDYRDSRFDVTDTKYDNYYWQNSETAFQLVNGKIYYIDKTMSSLMCTDSADSLYSVASTWMISRYSYYPGNFSKLSSIGNSLFFSLPDGVYRYNTKTKRVKKIFTPDTSSLGDYQNIYGFRIEGRTFCVQISNNANLSENPINYSSQTHEYKRYSVNLDYDSAKGSVIIEGDLDELEDITLTASPTSGSTFKGFYTDGTTLLSDDDADSNPLTVEFELTGDMNITAVFESNGRIIGRVYSTLYKPAKAELFKADGEFVASYTIRNGGFQFNSLADGVYNLVISGDTLAGVKIENLTITGGETLDLRNSSNPLLKQIKTAIGDLNGDGFVDISDVSSLLNEDVYGKTVTDSLLEDINSDHSVGIADITILLLAENYGSGMKTIKY